MHTSNTLSLPPPTSLCNGTGPIIKRNHSLRELCHELIRDALAYF